MFRVMMSDYHPSPDYDVTAIMYNIRLYDLTEHLLSWGINSTTMEFRNRP